MYSGNNLDLPGDERTGRRTQVDKKGDKSGKRGRMLNIQPNKRTVSRSRSSELIKVLKVSQTVKNLKEANVFEMPQYDYQAAPSKGIEDMLQNQAESQKIKAEEIQKIEQNEKANLIIQTELELLQKQKNQVRNILREDMIKQSEGIK